MGGIFSKIKNYYYFHYCNQNLQEFLELNDYCIYPLEFSEPLDFEDENEKDLIKLLELSKNLLMECQKEIESDTDELPQLEDVR